MSQVSKYPLSKTTKQRLFLLFWESISNLTNSQKAEEFFNDLLTPTEKIMLSKRLAIAIMLIKGYDYATIRSTIKVSPSTIGSISTWLKLSGSGYRKTVEKLLKRERVEKIAANINTAIEIIKPEKSFRKVLFKSLPNTKSKSPF
ncbi:hypothetical protein HY382_00725 [Candidatus Curtissbacteria bacterium]|nr:hypothetical protein [Candidatus Curtissbacteria bacterium]